MQSAAPEARPVLGGIVQTLGRSAQIAFAVLIISGPLMVWLRYGGVEGLSNWFWNRAKSTQKPSARQP